MLAQRVVVKCGLTDSADSTDYRFLGIIAVFQSVFSILIKHRLRSNKMQTREEGPTSCF